MSKARPSNDHGAVRQQERRRLRLACQRMAGASFAIALGATSACGPEPDAEELEEDIGSEVLSGPVSYNFESGTTAGLRCAGNCPRITTLAANGRYAASFDLTRNMPINYRTEATIGSNGQFAFEREYWLRFNYRYESWATDTDAEVAPLQIHNVDWLDGHECNLGSAVSTAPFLMVSSKDQVRFMTYPGKVAWTGPIEKNRWINLTVHFKMSTGNTGYIEAWKDGKKIVSVTGRTAPAKNGCGSVMPPPVFKMGVYKWNWKNKVTQSSRRLLLIDDLALGTGPVPR